MFDAKVATAVVGFFLRKSQNRKLNDLQLMKLLYLAERQSILEIGAPITGAHFNSLPLGPVLSEVLNLMNGRESNVFWSEHIAFVPRQGSVSNHCALRSEIDASEYVSEAVIEILSDIWDKHKHKSKWELVDLTHDFPEWDKAVAAPNAICKSTPIPVVSILTDGFKLPKEEAASIADSIAYFESV